MSRRSIADQNPDHPIEAVIPEYVVVAPLFTVVYADQKPIPETKSE